MTLAGIDLNSPYKWYCNSVDDGVSRCCDTYDETGNHIQQIIRYYLTGLEDWQYNQKNRCYYFLAENKYYDEIDKGSEDPMICSHFRWTADVEVTPLYMFCGGDKNEIQFNYDNGEKGVENFRLWLQNQYKNGKPVLVAYIAKYPIYYTPPFHKRTSQVILDGFLKKNNDV